MAGIADWDDKLRAALSTLADTVADGLGDASGELRDLAAWLKPDDVVPDRFTVEPEPEPEGDKADDDQAKPAGASKATTARKG